MKSIYFYDQIVPQERSLKCTSVSFLENAPLMAYFGTSVQAQK